jgi:hypothetical protein
MFRLGRQVAHPSVHEKDNVFALKKPVPIVVDKHRNCKTLSQKMLAQALEAGIEHFICHYIERKDDRGQSKDCLKALRPSVRIGPVSVLCPFRPSSPWDLLPESNQCTQSSFNLHA